MNWDELYINAIATLYRAHPRRQRKLARYIRLRIAKRAFQEGCEWQNTWGDPNNPGQSHPDLNQPECNICGYTVADGKYITRGNRQVVCEVCDNNSDYVMPVPE